MNMTRSKKPFVWTILLSGRLLAAEPAEHLEESEETSKVEAAVEESSPQEAAPVVPRRTRYRSPKEVTLDKSVVGGEQSNPSIGVITAPTSDNNNGLLRLRKDFMDRIANDAGEDAL